MTTTVANLASINIAKVVRKKCDKIPQLKGVSVEVSPIGYETIQMSFLSRSSFTDEQKAIMREFIQNGLKEDIVYIVWNLLSWTRKVRIRTCPRHKDDRRYTWFIEQR